MSVVDRPSVTDKAGAPAQPIDVLGQASVSEMRAVVYRDSVAPTGEPQAKQWPPPVELICCGSAGQKAEESPRASAVGEKAKTPAPESQTRAVAPAAAEAGTEQAKNNDQTKTPKDEPVESSSMAKQMQLLQRLADKNADARKHGQPAADQPSHPGDKPQLPKPAEHGYIYNEQEYNKAVEASSAQGKRMVFHCYADWCSPCRAMKTQSWDNADGKLDAVLKNDAIRVDINFDKAHDLMKKFGITSLPTTIIAEPGKDGAGPSEIDRGGIMGEAALISWLKKNLK